MNLILSIGGGGTKGIYNMNAVYWIQKLLQIDLDKKCSLIIGTSSGAIIGAMLSCGLLNRKNIESTNNVLNSIFPQMFDRQLELFQTRPKYKGLEKSKYLKLLFKDMLFGDVPNKLAIVTYSLEKRKPIVFCSWEKEFADIPLWKIVDASTAAPFFFPPVFVDDSHGWLVDGGLHACNPIVLTYNICKKEFDTFSILNLCLHEKPVPISIKQSIYTGARFWWRHRMFEMVMQGDEIETILLIQNILGKKYFLSISFEDSAHLDNQSLLTQCQIKDTVKNKIEGAYNDLLALIQIKDN